MVEARAFWDDIAEKYAGQPVGDPAAYEATLDHVRRYLRAGMQVRELGCGTGTTAVKLADTGAEIEGTDLSGEMIRIAQGRAAEAGAGNVTFRVAAAEEAGEGALDAVMCFNLLHLVDDVEIALRQVRAMLREGGLFLSKSPCLGGKPWFAPLIWGMQLIGKAPPMVHRFRPAELEAMIRAAGFEIVEVADYPRKLPNHFVVARAI